MARGIPKAKPRRLDKHINPFAEAQTGRSDSNAAAPAPVGCADTGNSLPVDTDPSVVIPADQYNRVVRACKTRPDILFDIALVLEGRADNETVQSVLHGHGLFEQDLDVLLDNPITGNQIKALRDDIRENGLSFRRKAAAMAEAFLPTVAQIINDSETPPQVVLQGVSYLSKWGGLEKVALDGAGAGVSVVINLGDTTKPVKVISGSSNG